MIKLVASDLDGTLLLNGAQKLPEELFPLIRGLKKEGILFVAASGRQYANMKRLFEPVLEDMAFICENGALAFQNGELLYEAAFEEKLAREITETIYAKVFLLYKRLLLYDAQNGALSKPYDRRSEKSL